MVLEAYAAAFLFLGIGLGVFLMLSAWFTAGIAGLTGYPIDETLGETLINLSLTTLCGGVLIAIVLGTLSLFV